MWYSGSSDGFSTNCNIGYAWSADSNIWNVKTVPVLDKGGFGDWDGTGVVAPKVYFDGTTYHMWYHGWNGLSLYDPGMIGYATSTNGLDWVKYTANPVLSIGQQGSFYDTWVMPGTVLYMNNEYRMWFTGWDGYATGPLRYFRIGYATSTDGISWTVHNNDSSVLDVGGSGTWDNYGVRFPSVLVHNNRYRVWYAGDDGNNIYNIGYAMGDIITGIAKNNRSAIKKLSCSPNPFREKTTLIYELQQSLQVQVSVYNYFGEKVLDLLNKKQQKGEHQISINGDILPAGIYLCTLRANRERKTVKLIKTE